MEIVQPPTKPNPTQIKSNYVFGIKIFLRRYVEVYGHLLSTCFENRVLECQEMVQRKFPDTKQKHVFWKICKVRKISGWLWDFLLENLKLKKNSDDVHQSVWRNRKSCVPEIIFLKKLKKNSKYYILYHLNFGPNFVFLGTALRRFSRCFFFNFLTDIFLQFFSKTSFLFFLCFLCFLFWVKCFEARR